MPEPCRDLRLPCLAGKQYYATVTLPSGAVVTTDVATVGANETTLKFEGIQGKMTGAQKVIAAGTYSYKVYKVGTAEPVATKDVKAVTVSLSNGAGYGSYTTGQKTSYVVVEDTTYGAVASTLNAVVPSTDSGYSFKGYEDANGVKLEASDSTNKIKADTTFSAIYSNPRVTAVSIDTADNILKFVFDATDIAKAVGAGEAAKIGSYDATVTGPNGFTKVIKGVKAGTDVTLAFGKEWESGNEVTSKLEAGEYTVSVAPVAAKDSAKVSDTVTYVSTKAAAAAFEGQANAVMTATTSTSTANAPVRYGDTLKSLASDGKSAIAALGYVDADAVPAAADAYYKDALSKVVEVEKANVAAKKALAKQADGSYKYVADTDYDKAIAAIDAVVAKWDANHDVKDGKYDASNDKAVNGKTVKAKAKVTVKVAK